MKTQFADRLERNPAIGQEAAGSWDLDLRPLLVLIVELAFIGGRTISRPTTGISYPDFSGRPEGLRNSSIMHRIGGERNNGLGKFTESLNSPLCSDDEFEST